ncbi:hypothetical protein ABH924_004962 [Arthrobacter sp. GAS37]|uniref:hypothetical protein n=1 Tax=Arthrobacter sp. GAS37 TaxID=3156261 RepID=UPI0038387FD9
MTTRRVSTRSVLTLIDEWQPENITLAATAALALGSIDPLEMLQLVLTDVPTLVRTYRRRVKTDANVLGDRELLSRLEEYAGRQVLAAAISVGGTMVYMWFDEEMTKVLGCVIGRDHRSQGEARTSDL